MCVEPLRCHASYHSQRLTQAPAVLEHLNDGVQSMQDGFAPFNESKPAYQRGKVPFVCWMLIFSRAGQEKLQILLTDLDKPINRMATQLSDIHDSLEGFTSPIVP